MTRPGIEPKSPGPLSNTLLWQCPIYIYIYNESIKIQWVIFISTSDFRKIIGHFRNLISSSVVSTMSNNATTRHSCCPVLLFFVRLPTWWTVCRFSTVLFMFGLKRSSLKLVTVFLICYFLCISDLTHPLNSLILLNDLNTHKKNPTKSTSMKHLHPVEIFPITNGWYRNLIALLRFKLNFKISRGTSHLSVCFLWHINLCRLFNANPFSYK